MSQFQLSCLILKFLTVIGAVMSVDKTINSIPDPYKYDMYNYFYFFILAFSFIFILSAAHFRIVSNLF